MDQLAKITKLAVSPSFALPSDVRSMIDVYYSNDDTIEQSLQLAEGHEIFIQGGDLSAGGAAIAKLADSEEVVQFLNALIQFAIRRGASDIHIEAREHESRVRYRIDGTLQEVLTFPRKLHSAVIVRIKILTGQNISELRLPTDGRFSYQLGSNKINFRVSTTPTQFGEKGVLRLLGSTGRQSLLSLDRMMISQSILVPFRRVTQSPSGIIFLTGPTGSGKTTTLYATLAELNQSGLNIATIEDPIEMQLEDINQSQVDTAIDLSFAKMLRSLLRQDPDIILIGEIRDLETAKIATEAALTGHLVLATLHTNTAPEAIVRLEEMGVDHYIIAPSVVASVGQRLAARICENCKEPYKPSIDVLRRYFEFGDDEKPEVVFYRGRGCNACNHTGYKGRVSFHEIFVVNADVREKISAQATQQELIASARKTGYQALRYDGLKKVLLGLTTIEQVESQTQIEFV